MPRPRMDVLGNIVPEKDLRDLWVVIYDNRGDLLPLPFLGSVAYLSREGRWSSFEHEAAAWLDEDKALAEEVATKVVLSNPRFYLGFVQVSRVRG